MPIAKGFMTVLPSVHLSSFLIIGSGVIILSCISFIYVRTHLKKRHKFAWTSKIIPNLSVFSALLVCEKGLIYGKIVL